MKEKDIKYIKTVIEKTNISKLCKEEKTNLSNVCFGRTTEEKINKVKTKLQNNISDLAAMGDSEELK